MTALEKTVGRLRVGSGLAGGSYPPDGYLAAMLSALASGAVKQAVGRPVCRAVVNSYTERSCHDRTRDLWLCFDKGFHGWHAICTEGLRDPQNSIPQRPRYRRRIGAGIRKRRRD